MHPCREWIWCTEIHRGIRVNKLGALDTINLLQVPEYRIVIVRTYYYDFIMYLFVNIMPNKIKDNAPCAFHPRLCTLFGCMYTCKLNVL